MDLKALGHKISFTIKRIMKEKGMSTQQMSCKIGIRSTTLSTLFSRIESGQVSLRKLKAIADTLEVDIKFFFD